MSLSLPSAPGPVSIASSLPGSASDSNSGSYTYTPTAPITSALTPGSTPSSTPYTIPTSSSDPTTVVSTTMTSGYGPSATSSTLLPITANFSSSHKHAGAIAGGVVGGLAAVAALVGCLLFYRYRRKQNHVTHRHGRHSSMSGSHAKYDAYPAENGLAQFSKNKPLRHASTASTATMINPRGDGLARSLSIPRMSSEDASSVEDDKSFSTPSTLNGHKPLDLIEVVPPLPHLESLPTTPSNAAFPDGRTRTRSLTSQNRAAALAQLDSSPTSTHYPPRSPDSVSPSTHRESWDARFLTNPPNSPSATPHSDVEMNRMNRSLSGARRAARKAVPKYDESEFSGPPPSATLPPSGNQQDDGSRSSPTSPSSPHSYKAKSIEDLVNSGLQVPELNHKSSFGDAQALHYLIPDLPPPQRD